MVQAQWPRIGCSVERKAPGRPDLGCGLGWPEKSAGSVTWARPDRPQCDGLDPTHKKSRGLSWAEQHPYGACPLLREGKSVRYQFIDRHRDEYAVGVLCRVLDVSRSGYYADAGKADQQPESTGPASGRADSQHSPEEQGSVWCAPRPCRTAPAGPKMWTPTGGEVDAPRGAARPWETQVPSND